MHIVVTKGEGVYIYFVMFSYERFFYHALLPFVSTSLLFYKTFTIINFLSLKCFTFFLFMEVLTSCAHDKETEG